jgi:hypothetical protein
MSWGQDWNGTRGRRGGRAHAPSGKRKMQGLRRRKPSLGKRRSAKAEEDITHGLERITGVAAPPAVQAVDEGEGGDVGV